MFSVEKSVMLLVDVQGRLAQLMVEKESLFKSLQIMIQSMRILDIPVLWMEQIPQKIGPTLAELSQLMPDNQPIEKSSFSCCKEPGFMSALEKTGREQVILTGIETHICVYQTGADLVQKGYEVQVVSDCVSSRTKENKAIGIQRLLDAGVSLTSVEMLLFELLEKAGGEQFRQIARLIK